MKHLLTLLLLSATAVTSLAEDRPFRFRQYFDSREFISTPCANASDSKYAIPSGSQCSLGIRINLPFKPGANLIRIAKQKRYHPITFWIEQRVEDGTGEHWRKISGTKTYRFNAVLQTINVVITRSSILRVAIDYKKQAAFADTSGDEYRVVVR